MYFLREKFQQHVVITCINNITNYPKFLALSNRNRYNFFIKKDIIDTNYKVVWHSWFTLKPKFKQLYNYEIKLYSPDAHSHYSKKKLSRSLRPDVNKLFESLIIQPNVTHFILLLPISCSYQNMKSTKTDLIELFFITTA